MDISDINEQYLSEFLGALQAAINQMSADGVRISHVTSKNMELSRYMADILDDDWKDLRGMEVVSVGLAGLSYSEESQKLINMQQPGCYASAIPMSGKAMSRARLPVVWRLLVPTLPAVWQALWAWALE